MIETLPIAWPLRMVAVKQAVESVGWVRRATRQRLPLASSLMRAVTHHFNRHRPIMAQDGGLRGAPGLVPTEASPVCAANPPYGCGGPMLADAITQLAAWRYTKEQEMIALPGDPVRSSDTGYNTTRSPAWQPE